MQELDETNNEKSIKVPEEVGEDDYESSEWEDTDTE